MRELLTFATTNVFKGDVDVGPSEEFSTQPFLVHKLHIFFNRRRLPISTKGITEIHHSKSISGRKGRARKIKRQAKKRAVFILKDSATWTSTPERRKISPTPFWKRGMMLTPSIFVSRHYSLMVLFHIRLSSTCNQICEAKWKGQYPMVTRDL